MATRSATRETRFKSGRWLAGALVTMLLGAALMLFGYSQMDPATQKTARFTMLLAASGPASAVSALLQPIFESVERVQASAQTVTAVAILCLGSLLTLAGAVVMLLHLPRRTV